MVRSEPSFGGIWKKFSWRWGGIRFWMNTREPHVYQHTCTTVGLRQKEMQGNPVGGGAGLIRNHRRPISRVSSPQALIYGAISPTCSVNTEACSSAWWLCKLQKTKYSLEGSIKENLKITSIRNIIIAAEGYLGYYLSWFTTLFWGKLHSAI